MQRLQPALLGGLFIGVLSSLPLVGLANACCCLWVVGGGVVTVYLQRQRPPIPNSSDVFEAVLGGVIAGMVGAGIETILSAVLHLNPSPAEVQEMMDRFPQIAPELRDRVVTSVAAGGVLFLSMVRLFVLVPMYAIFSVAGALLGVATLKKRQQPPAPLPAP